MELTPREWEWVIIALGALKDWKEVSVNRAYEWGNVGEAELIQADMVDISILIDKIKKNIDF